MDTTKPLTILVIVFVFVSNFAFAYGNTTNSKKACKKPTLTQITPAHLATVEPEAKFSFQTSNTTLPNSIKVVANKISVGVHIEKTIHGFKISGKLPASIKKKYVRIDFEATTTNRCHGIDGWLLKVNALDP